MQRLLVSLEVKRGETLGQLNELFRRMVQLKEELELVEQQIQVGRGVMDGLEQAQDAIKEQIKAEEIANFQASKDKEVREIVEKRKTQNQTQSQSQQNLSQSLMQSESKTSVPGTKEFVGGGNRVGDEEHK